MNRHLAARAFSCALAAIPLAVSPLTHAEESQPAAGAATVDVAALPAGVYVVRSGASVMRVVKE